jgi:hypothetical protein
VAFEQANHYVVTGGGIEAVVDTTSISGRPVVSLTVDGTSIADPSFAVTARGIVVDGVVKTVPDSHTIGICLTIPEVNLSEPVVTFAGYAALTTALTSIGGPALVPGPRHLYELRPVAGTASAVQS